MDQIIGNSIIIQYIKEQIRNISQYPWPVLILGETGVGKELVATAIHNAGPRKNKPFVCINCGGMPESLIESELFGYVKGAFTGANRDRSGKFEDADGGTIFLDEIGNSPIKFQLSLLRVLETRKISRIGANCEKNIDVRVICATNKPFQELKEKAEVMREDLFNRISSMIINIPPLMERKEDIPDLANFFIRIFSDEIMKFSGQDAEITIADSALNLMKKENFKGNVRELRNMLQRAIMMSGKIKGMISAEDICRAIRINNGECFCGESDKPMLRIMLEKKPLEYFIKTIGWKKERMRETGLDKETLREFEKNGYEKCLKDVNGNISKLSKLLGITPQSLIERLKNSGCNAKFLQ
jgi:transcriptional regulator with PAS, ATPase and Fis domain